MLAEHGVRRPGRASSRSPTPRRSAQDAAGRGARPSPALLHRRAAAHTREDPRIVLGASPRAGLLLFRAAKALAALAGRDHVLPDDVQDSRPGRPHPPPGPRPPAGPPTPRRRAPGRRGDRRDAGAAEAQRRAPGARHRRCSGSSLIAGGDALRRRAAVGRRASALVAAGGGQRRVGRARRARRGRCSRTLGAPRVVEDEPVSIVLDVRARRAARCRRRDRATRCCREPAPLHARRRAARACASRRASSAAAGGCSAPASVVVCDPFGLRTREVARARRARRRDPRAAATRARDDARPPAATRRGIAPRRAPARAAPRSSSTASRPLRDGTPASRIYWPALARGAEPHGALPARRRRRASPLVVLDPREPAGGRGPRRRGARGRVARARARAGAAAAASLLPGDRRPTELDRRRSHGWPHVHARLAARRAGRPRRRSRASPQRRGPIVFVSARRRQRAAARALAHGARRGARAGRPGRARRPARGVRRRRLQRLRRRRAPPRARCMRAPVRGRGVTAAASDRQASASDRARPRPTQARLPVALRARSPRSCVLAAFGASCVGRHGRAGVRAAR